MNAPFEMESDAIFFGTRIILYSDPPGSRAHSLTQADPMRYYLAEAVPFLFIEKSDRRDFVRANFRLSRFAFCLPRERFA
jgi:hypothetical protein